ncbi:histidine kinase [Bacillus glycinifermentans]|uniref:histidine kinase n=1 Tax=Bacillus glycinifermentans TaxID=1664069 RepID=A0A0J6EKR4_9BACI|nr:sensor histidine kinase [Bacillus glycinifermentans]ATH93800.1 sensor histidine kinase [Bacillus glycinifermentans]KMM59407.1 histidine kinase [Bacillus glycinifermentans]KRT90022.1 histidine kinase [Bacillus glycinifermentans]MEC0483698.1 sensor histidine kinase [Bacillus glycinifermentans]MEC0496193.1 sensor histidine kinase [Bacillus glycinifermentans]
MIKAFLTERRSWIAMFICQQILVLFIACIDSSIPFAPILYVVYLCSLLFIVFVLIRFRKETKFYKSLKEWEHSLDVTSISEPETPFESIIEKSISGQTEQLKQAAAQHQLALENEKDELMAWIHEVKTPLTAMHLIIERMEDQSLKSQLAYEWLRIHLLLDQQLHQKRISFIETDLSLEILDLKTLIFKEIKDLQSWCIQKGIGFDIELEAKEVLSDAKWLAFIVRQLLTNAVKYSEASDIVVKSYERDERIYLEVKDFGRGIDQKDIPRVFEKGFTSTTDHDQASTGMGLYLAKKAAKPLLIHIDICSAPGAGSTFTLTFPKRNEFERVIGV